MNEAILFKWVDRGTKATIIVWDVNACVDFIGRVRLGDPLAYAAVNFGSIAVITMGGVVLSRLIREWKESARRRENSLVRH